MTTKRREFFFQRRGDSTSSHTCCVPKCSASAKCNSFLSFHMFPKDPKKQKKWMINIRRTAFQIKDNIRVCSRHFRPTDLIEPSTSDGRRRLKIGAVPVLFEWNNYSLPSTSPGVWEQTENICHDHNYCSDTHNPQRQTQEAVISKFGLERFAASDNDIKFYTRFESYAHLMSFWSQIEPATQQVHVTGAWTASYTDVHHAVDTMSLQPVDEFFLFMIYLSLGLVPNDLAQKFSIHESTVSQINKTWANFLYTALGAVSIWQDEDTIKANLPETFQNHSDTCLILDCVELCCQTPHSPLHPTEKSHVTLKGLIGVAPHGPLTFVSCLFEGCLSDSEFLKQSGLVCFLKPTMAIMVNKNFHVQDCVPCKVHKPEVKTPSNEKLRLHIEQIFRRMKGHQLFSTTILLSLAGGINQLFAVSFLLVNYQNGALVET